MHAPELSDGIIAVLHEDALVQFLCSCDANGCVDGFVTLQIEVAHEFVEEQTTQTLGGTAVARKQRTLHGFRQIDQCKNGKVEVGEIATQNRRLIRSELLWNVDRHESRYYENASLI